MPKGAGCDWDKIIFKGLTVQGIYGRKMYETWYKMTQLVLSGFPLGKVLTHQLHIDDFQKGFDLMEAGKAGKVVPVSYTHLDVYKRQQLDGAIGTVVVGDHQPLRRNEAGRASAQRDHGAHRVTGQVGPVSYTHLDVYKRQALAFTCDLRLSASARLATGPTRTRLSTPLSVFTCSTKALKPPARSLSRMALASAALENAPSCTANPTLAAAGLLAAATGAGVVTAGFAATGLGASTTAGLAAAGAGVGGLAAGLAGSGGSDCVVTAALGVAGWATEAVALAGAGTGVEASRVTTCAFTSLRTCLLYTSCR